MTANDTTRNAPETTTATRTRRLAGAGALAPAVLQSRPLQSMTVERNPTSMLEIGFLVALVVVGGLLTYQAFRGYRRNDDRSMALFGTGLFLLTVVHATLKLATAFGEVSLLAVGQPFVLVMAAVSQAVDVVGLVVIFYAILR